MKTGKAFIWLLSQCQDAGSYDELPKPFFVSSIGSKTLRVKCDEAHKRYADEVRENVPLFSERVSLSQNVPLMPNEPEDIEVFPEFSSPIPVEHEAAVHEDDKESIKYSPSLAPDDAPEPVGPSIVSGEHNILHLPKRHDCAVCQEAKQDALPARRINQPHVMSDGKPSEKFGDRIHADHIIISKDRLSDGHKGLNGESVCLILYDDFTKIVAAYPAKTKSTDQCIRACNHFLGSRPAQELHSDNAPELEACAAKIGLVPDLTVPYRKTAEINRKIRTIEDCVRCCLVQIGNQNAAWPLAVEYTTSAMTLDVWRSLHGHSFNGIRYPFGALIHYRPNAKKSKLGAKTKPGLFIGWRIEAGMNWKGVYKVVDLDNVRAWIAGKASLSVSTTMTVVPHEGKDVFPLRSAVQRQHELLEDLPRMFADSQIEEDLKAIDDPLDDDRISNPEANASSRAGSKRHEKITVERFIEFGPSPDCVACSKGLDNHTQECRKS